VGAVVLAKSRTALAMLAVARVFGFPNLADFTIFKCLLIELLNFLGSFGFVS